jgi:hypothetical protein
MSNNFSSTQSPLVGKYVYVSKLEFSLYGESWGYECYCISFNNNVYTVRNKFGKEFKSLINQITKIIDITEYQKYRIGDIVQAKTEYIQKDNDWYTEYCEVLSVKNFANDYDYVLKNVQTGKIYHLPQQEIIKSVTMSTGKYVVGAYIGVQHFVGPQWDMETIIKNGTIINVNSWYDRVTYDVKLDDGEIKKSISEDIIVKFVTAKVQKTKEQIEQDTEEFLRKEEERLLFELEMIRAARTVKY